jgi:hypothetical protein
MNQQLANFPRAWCLIDAAPAAKTASSYSPVRDGKVDAIGKISEPKGATVIDVKIASSHLD